ncbi:uncharacterized protein BDZ83DRAFT_187362 [Colletotrichum acutatum]|uniref:Uncharacterized protein n=1 Tax=Glomerella acutata TaxID=27357 RepID=A0AAD8XIH9_GLOAC|nr:uncharacterized protein BDZ83DRAFT_187362 [Colletotrichum acutatum]KAK1727726.1 hypothetical protein BDZ83DRAFT_187362 [Colletotrichum acutatum]
MMSRRLSNGWTSNLPIPSQFLSDAVNNCFWISTRISEWKHGRASSRKVAEDNSASFCTLTWSIEQRPFVCTECSISYLIFESPQASTVNNKSDTQFHTTRHT